MCVFQYAYESVFSIRVISSKSVFYSRKTISILFDNFRRVFLSLAFERFLRFRR